MCLLCCSFVLFSYRVYQTSLSTILLIHQKLFGHPVLSMKVCRNVWFCSKISKILENEKIWLDGVYIPFFRLERFSPIFLWWNTAKFRFLWGNITWNIQTLPFLSFFKPNFLGHPVKIAKILCENSSTVKG